MHRRLAAAATTLCATLLLAACTQPAPQPPPPPSPGPSMPADPPTSASPSPSPSPTPDPAAADKAAVAKAYRESFAEFNRLEMAGGATKLSQVLLDTTSGDDRAHYLMWLKEDKTTHQRQLNPGKLAGIIVGSGNSKKRNLTACEDYTGVKWTLKGKPFKPSGSPRNVQRAIALKGKDGRWRIDYIASTSVKDFNKAICGEH